MFSKHALLTFLALIAIAYDTFAQERALPSTQSPSIVAAGRPADPDCASSLRDQARGACLRASSIPSFGLLLPYPGLHNVFDAPAFVGGGERNQASGAWSTVGGGYRNVASDDNATVGGGEYNAASRNFATVGGGRRNTAFSRYDTVAGGYNNHANGSNAAVGGGKQNYATGSYAAIAGGTRNEARGLGCVGGGMDNEAGYYCTVSGGHFNSASGSHDTVGGGFFNIASGGSSTVPGGQSNSALQSFSFAAGRYAQAGHVGAFVWGDSQTADKLSSAPDEFNVYASGGTRIFSSSDSSSGVILAPGAGSWSSVSDRAAKENLIPIEPGAVLARVVAMPISTWNYRTQDESIRHMGPMAQDFHAAFGLGLGASTIDTIDPDGVALAAIQGLNQADAELRELLAEREAELIELRAEMQTIQQLLAGLLAR